MYVRATADGTWLDVPIHIERATEPDPHAPPPPKLVRTLVKAVEQGLWSVNTVGVPVFPGLVVSFREEQAARWFLNQPHRAERVDVVTGQIVVFHNDEDAQHFVEQGLAERVSKSEAKAQLAESASKPDNVLPIEKGGKRAGAQR
jgi:hypothetical protein